MTIAATSRPKGPRFSCPACGEQKVSDPVLCHSTKRFVKSGFWFWKKVCQRADTHLHQHCLVCGNKWTCSPKEAT